MHGIVHAGLRRFILEHHGEQGLKAVLDEANMHDQYYLVVGSYQDDELHAMINAASRVTGESVDALHEQYGRFIVPDLLRLSYALIRPHWKTKELLLNTEETMHRHVRRTVSGAEPPGLQFEDTGPGQLRLHYNSSRRMPGVAKGIMRGMADHFGESLTIDETRHDDGTSVMDVQIHG